MRLHCVLFVAAIFLAGCQPGAVRPGGVRGFPVSDENRVQLDQEIEKKLDAVLATCTTVSNALQGKTDSSRKVVLTIAAIGIIAGSIIVPALAAKATVSKSAVAAWGGVAGAANAGQSVLTQTGLSPVALSDNYREFSKQFNADLDAFLQSNGAEEAYKKLYVMEAHCRVAPIAAVGPVSGTSK